ncbi:AraC family transcriptional regulator [Bifidobacterium callitrichos]|uniref:AraC family transcriptional regulator n=1 Tax=Bifidobacterium callitrichos TaxID=762209 RepID=A0A5M9ZDM6_9BIFI|nr:helix-turn-helix domain-containing protein [Bifidobacterium callitrichos]KAA8817138.1 AraC family transcriptional regulator [Bifidobacterium callitrichos]
MGVVEPQETRRLSLLSDLSERVPYAVRGLPVYARCDSLSIYDYRCACHWHRDLEFVRVVSGTMRYFVNGAVTRLAAGEGLVVNSSRLHYGFSPDRQEARFSCAVIGPQLVEGFSQGVAARCERAFAQDMDDALFLSPDVDWQRNVLMDIDRIVEQLHGDRRLRPSEVGRPMDDAADLDPLPAAMTAIGLIDQVLDRFRPAAASDSVISDATVPDPVAPASDDQRDRLTVLHMTGLIQRRFAEPLSLDDIAAAGSVGRSRCCALFRRYVGRTPNEYLADRRLEEAKRLLDGTNGSVAEIARACGFASSSYFISVFRRRTGLTPKAYRAR